MWKVTILPTPVEVISYTSKKDGSPQSLRKQTGYLHTFTSDGQASPFPDKFAFLLNRDEAPYAPGEYTLHPSALIVDREGRLAALPRLTPATKR